MYLKELTINGFKSFARKSEFEFSVPITGIVGPNGSGKSNVAESFRFVLGEQSVKSMRGKRGEDLIWGGSEKIARGNRASVELVFDNTHRTFALDFDEVKIERVVHRDGQNEYKLNGSTVRLKDVHELLANANIGSTGHHIISQGEADRVLSAGPRERREMIEDALGLKVFQIKKLEADRKLQKTLENIAQVQSLRREAAPHLKYLKKQVERAERSLEIQERLKRAMAEYLKREDVYLAAEYDRLTALRRTPVIELEQVKTSLAEAKRALEQTEDTELAERIAGAERDLKSISQERQQALNAVSQIEGQIGFLERRITAAQNRPTEEAKLIPQAEIATLISEVSSNAEKALHRGGEQTLARALADVVHQLRSFLKKNEAVAIDPTVADREALAQLRDQLPRLHKTAAALETAVLEAESAVVKLRSAKVTDLELQREAERSMFSLLQQQRDFEAAIRQIDTELQGVERDREDFKRELQEAVSLLGRGAAEYLSFVVTTESGEAVTNEMICAEEREVQRSRRRELEKLKIRLEELGVGATEDLLKEYQSAKERDEFLEKELLDLETSVQNLKTLIADLQAKLEEQFTEGIKKIAVEFHTFFTLMFGGGQASLETVVIKNRQSDEDETEDDGAAQLGVELSVSLPNKRVRGLDMLSGGERALTSIALIFAMSQVNPPPFIILDETDAALDEANSRRYGDMIEALAKKSQLVLITHNRETMSRAGILYGITMGADGASKMLSVKFEEAAMNAK